MKLKSKREFSLEVFKVGFHTETRTFFYRRGPTALRRFSWSKRPYESMTTTRISRKPLTRNRRILRVPTMKVNNRRLGFWATLLCITGCTNNETIATSVEPTEPLWAHQLAVNPAAFEQLLVRSPKDGWISYHQRDYHSAYTHFSANPSPSSLTGAYRSADAIADQYAMLSRITEKAATRYFDEVAKIPSAHIVSNGKRKWHNKMLYAKAIPQ